MQARKIEKHVSLIISNIPIKYEAYMLIYKYIRHLVIDMKWILILTSTNNIDKSKTIIHFNDIRRISKDLIKDLKILKAIRSVNLILFSLRRIRYCIRKLSMLNPNEVYEVINI